MLFAYTYVVTFTEVLYFLIWLWVTVYCTFILVWRSLISISCRADLLAINSFSLYCMGMSWFRLHFWKIVLLTIEFLVDSFFFFPLSTFNKSSQCILSSMVSNGKLAANLFKDRLYVISYLSLAAAKILSCLWLSTVWL